MNRKINRNSANKYAREWYRNNKEKGKEYRRRYREKNKIKDNESKRKYAIGIKQKAINIMGGKCVKCGISDIRILTINHLHHQDVKKMTKTKRRKRGRYAYLAIIKGEQDMTRIDLRCYNCNILYEYESGRYRDG